MSAFTPGESGLNKDNFLDDKREEKIKGIRLKLALVSFHQKNNKQVCQSTPNARSQNIC